MELDATRIIEFIAGKCKLTTQEQASLRAECPYMWGLYFGEPGWLYSDEFRQEVRMAQPYIAGLA